MSTEATTTFGSRWKWARRLFLVHPATTTMTEDAQTASGKADDSVAWYLTVRASMCVMDIDGNTD